MVLDDDSRVSSMSSSVSQETRRPLPPFRGASLLCDDGGGGGGASAHTIAITKTFPRSRSVVPTIRLVVMSQEASTNLSWLNCDKPAFYSVGHYDQPQESRHHISPTSTPVASSAAYSSKSLPRYWINHRGSQSADVTMFAQKAVIGTPVASYRDDMPPKHYRRIVAHETTTPIMVMDTREYANLPLKQNQRVRSVSTGRVETRETTASTAPKVTLESVTATNPKPIGIPNSYYLLQKSQDSIHATKASTIDDNNGINASYRTVIRFGRSKDVAADVEAERHRPLPCAVLRSGEVKSHSAKTAELNTSLQRHPRGSSPSKISRLRSLNSASAEQLSPATIRRQCEEIYRVVANYGSQTSPPPEGFESGYNTLSKPREPEPRSRMSSTSSIGKASPPLFRGSSLPPMQHPLQVDLSNHDARSISSKGSSIENKDSEIDRLQRELYDAQVCNYRLNNQMGKLVDKEWRREESILKKSLKDRTNEVDLLKKKLEKAERDRRNAESRQPSNVQALQSEKRELQIALEREESEKHELFMQINQLIAELADLRGNASAIADAKDLREQNDQLRGKLSVIEGERDHFQKSYSTLETGQQAKEDELLATKSELERIKASAESERQKLKQEIADHQKEVQIKSAALASLRLAKAEPSTSAQDYDKVVQEVIVLKRDLAEKNNAIAASAASNDEIRRNVTKLESELSAILSDKQNLESRLTEKHEEAKILRSELTSASSATASETVELRELLDAAEKRSNHFKQNLDLVEKHSNDLELHASELEEKLAQAEDEIEKLLESLQRRDGVSAELASERQKFEQLQNVFESLKKERASVETELVKRKTELSQGETRIAELEAKLEGLSKENAKLMEKASVEEELVTLVSSLQETRSILSAKDAEINELRKVVSDHQDESDKLAAELADAKATLQRTSESESLRPEIERLQNELHETNEEFNRLVDDFQKAQKLLVETEQRANSANAENVELREGLLKSQAEFRDARAAIDRLNSQLDRVNAALKAAETNQSVETELTKLRTELREAHESLDTLQAEVTKAKNAKESAEETVYLKVAEIEKLASEKRRVNEELEAAQNEVLTLTSNFEKAHKNEATFQDEIVEVRGVAAQLRDELREANSNIDRLKAELHDAHGALKVAQEASAKSSADATEVIKIRAESAQLRENLAHATVEVTRLTAELEESQKVDFKQKDLAEVAENRLEKLRLVEMEKSRLETRLREQQNDLESLQKELQKFVSKESAVAAEGERATAEVKAALSVAETKLADLETELNQLRTRELVHADEIEKHNQAATEAEKRLHLLQAEKTSMETSFFEAQRKDSASQSQIAELEKELKDKESQLASLMQSGIEVNVLRNSLNELHQRLEVTLEAKTELETELREYRAKKDEASQKEASLVGDLAAAQRAKSELTEELEAKQAAFTADLKKVQAESAENVRRLTELLTAEAQRVESIVKEKESLLIEKAELLEEMKSASTNGTNDEIHQKLSELTAENARLAGDLLKKESTTSNGSTAEFERNLLIKQREWSGERVKLEEQITELQEQVVRFRAEKEHLEGEVARMKQITESIPPVPKPRRANTSLTNLTMDTVSERSITPNGDEEEVRKLRADLEKQKRLITVLRKKLQQQQLDSHRAAKLSTGSVPFFN